MQAQDYLKHWFIVSHLLAGDYVCKKWNESGFMTMCARVDKGK